MACGCRAGWSAHAVLNKENRATDLPPWSKRPVFPATPHPATIACAGAPGNDSCFMIVKERQHLTLQQDDGLE